MWVWTLNWGEIRHDLVVGSCPIRAADLDRLCDETGVSAVLSVQTDECRAALDIDYRTLEEHGSGRGILLRNSPIRDFDPQDQRRRLPAAVACLAELLGDGHRTYVHCTAGINRAPLVSLAYLTFVEGMGVDEATTLIRRGRPEASPYWDAYYGCREDALAPHAAALALDPLAERELLRSAFGAAKAAEVLGRNEGPS